MVNATPNIISKLAILIIFNLPYLQSPPANKVLIELPKTNAEVKIVANLSYSTIKDIKLN